MTRRINRTPTLDEVISVALENRLDAVRVALPAQVKRYDHKSQTADVKPVLKINTITPSGVELTPESLPIIRKVPVIFPRAGDFFISFPIKDGDHVLLVFCDRSIDAWTAGDGSEVNPIDLRSHDISDAVAYPGLYPFTRPLKDASKDDMVIGKDKDISMRIRKKEIEFVTEGSEKLSVAIAEKLQDLYKTIKAAFDGHIHATGVGPSGPPSPTPTFPPWDAGINSNKVKVPEN